jgi:hypothetical protein
LIAFTFFNQKTSGNFSGLTFDIGASSVKWSIHLLATGSSSSDANSTAGGGLTLRYCLPRAWWWETTAQLVERWWRQEARCWCSEEDRKPMPVAPAPPHTRLPRWLFSGPSADQRQCPPRPQRQDGNKGGSSANNVGLIVGVAVAVPVAVALVLLVIGTALGISWQRKRLARRSAGSVHFDRGADDDHNAQLWPWRSLSRTGNLE